MTTFAIRLNELTPGLATRVAPTDFRLRPDQRLTELGRWDEANAEKQRLEHKQRLELRDWQEKVEAMKRMQDREGDA